METDTSENSRDSDMDTSLSVPSSPAPSTTVINNKHSASNHLTNHNHIAVRSSSVVSSNGETDTMDVYNNMLAGGECRGNSRPGSSSNNNRNNKESWNFNCRLRVKVCKEVKKPGRGELQTCFLCRIVCFLMAPLSSTEKNADIFCLFGVENQKLAVIFLV